MLICPDCKQASPAGTCFCVACSLPLPDGGPAAIATRGVRLVEENNLAPTGFALKLPDTGYEGTLLLGRTDLAGGTVVDIDLTQAGGLDKRVSRRHAQLQYGHGQVSVMDWASAHGTWLNKQRLKSGEPALVADGDELRLADFVFRVQMK